MNTEDKAREIAKRYYRSARQITDSQKECYESAKEMAKWKNEQFIKWLTCDAKFYNKYGYEIDIDTDALIKDFK